MAITQGGGDSVVAVLEEVSRIVVSADSVEDKARRLLWLAIRVAGGDGGVVCWRTGSSAAK
ncbi:MAG: hypothetical protein IT452_02565, partial [Planctomycetia bacterium]|nr:hypothetical protein [Planctomycetia bacterium]